MKKKIGCAAVFLAQLGLLVACTPTAGEVVSSCGVTDQLGRTVEFDNVPQRIVSLAPSNTEILFALGLDDRVVGVTEYCDYPAAARDKAVIGGFSTGDLERVVALSPDLVLATSMHEADVLPALEKRGLTVFVLAPATLDEVLESISLVGEVTGKVEEAAGLVNDMNRRISAVTAKTAGLSSEQRPRVFFITWHDPLMTPGSETRHDELIQMAGGVNIARDLIGYADISLEAVIEANPEVMIAGVGMGDGEDLPAQFMRTEPRLGNTEARRNGWIYEVDTDLEGRPGPRIVDALEAFARFIHPELFAGG
ncbi:MAG: cobalamin-binding protein [Dehalococcoidales bacterium]|nr:cobalamin-binding protein [Dehalococcoidales bacterium]